MNSILWSDSPTWIAMGWTILHFTWLATAVGVVAALARRLLRSASAELRHGVALGLLSALALSPAVIFASQFQAASPIQRGRITPHTGTGIERIDDARSAKDARNDQPITTQGAFSSPLDGAGRARLDVVVPYLPWFWLSGSTATLALLATGVIAVERLRSSSQVVAVGDLPRRCCSLARLAWDRTTRERGGL